MILQGRPALLSRKIPIGKFFIFCLKNMKKLNVLHVIPSLGTGGAEKLVLDFLIHYDKAHFNMAVVSLYAKEKTMHDKGLEKIGANVFYLNKKLGIDLRCVLKINTVIKKFKPVVVHTHLYSTKYVLLPVFINRVPVRVHTVHTIALKEFTKADIIIQRAAYKLFNVTPVGISTTIRDSIQQLYRLENIPLIYNGVNTKKYSIAVKKEADNIVRLINVASFSRVKNHDMLLDAFKIVADTCQNVKLILVGDGELREEIEKKIGFYNLFDKVELMGTREDVPDLLAQSDIFVMSSRYEGLPLTVLEAMASGLPIVATHIGGVPDIVHNNVNGILVEPENPNALARGIVELVKNADLRKNMGGRSRKLSDQYDINKTQREYEKLYVALYTQKKSSIM
ncbi:MAG: glycosyltransferase [Pseudomonadota bacterium]